MIKIYISCILYGRNNFSICVFLKLLNRIIPNNYKSSHKHSRKKLILSSRQNKLTGFKSEEDKLFLAMAYDSEIHGPGVMDEIN